MGGTKQKTNLVHDPEVRINDVFISHFVIVISSARDLIKTTRFLHYGRNDMLVIQQRVNDYAYAILEASL
jgi:hypothetical protein